MATIKDIADKLGLSISTVSKGLNGASDIGEQTRQQVLDTAIELGYISKKSSKLTKRKLCIFIENMGFESIDQFGYEIIVAFKLAAAQRHCEVAMVPVNLAMQSDMRYDEYMQKHDYSGGFLLGFTLHDDYLKQLEHTTIPTVLLDNFVSNKNVAYVGTDNYEGISLVINHLKELGHSKIAFLNGAKNSMVSQERQEAFEKSLVYNNLTVYPELISHGDYNVNFAGIYVPNFLKEGATAIVCASDVIASGVLQELAKLSIKVPTDISVTGYDNVPISQYTYPQLTTVNQSRHDLGRIAFVAMESLMDGIDVEKLLLRPRLIIRDSTGKLGN